MNPTPDQKPDLELSKWWLIVLGALFMVSGLFSLFFLPSNFFYDNITLYSSGAEIPMMIATFLGWTFMVYGILQSVQIKKSNALCRLTTKVPGLNTWELNNQFFVGLTFVFIVSVTGTFLFLAPKEQSLGEMAANFERKMDIMVNNIKNGKFPIKTKQVLVPSMCDYDSIVMVQIDKETHRPFTDKDHIKVFNQKLVATIKPYLTDSIIQKYSCCPEGETAELRTYCHGHPYKKYFIVSDGKGQIAEEVDTSVVFIVPLDYQHRIKIPKKKWREMIKKDAR